MNFVFIGTISAQSDIKDVDFNNFTYQPFCGTAEPQTMTVKNGIFFSEIDVTPPTIDMPPAESKKTSQQSPIMRVFQRRYFSLYTTIYGDINGDAIDEAIVLTTCSTGGTGSYTEGFIYGIRDGNVQLLTRIEGGDRALGGLRSVKIENNLIVVERSRPDSSGDACCTEFVETASYRFSEDRVTPVGEKTSVALYPATRLNFPEGGNQVFFNLKISRDDKIKRFIISGRRGRTLNISTNHEKSTIRLYQGDATLLVPKPLQKGLDVRGKSNFTAKLNQTGDFIFEVSNLTTETLDVTVNVEIS